MFYQIDTECAFRRELIRLICSRKSGPKAFKRVQFSRKNRLWCPRRDGSERRRAINCFCWFSLYLCSREAKTEKVPIGFLKVMKTIFYLISNAFERFRIGKVFRSVTSCVLSCARSNQWLHFDVEQTIPFDSLKFCVCELNFGFLLLAQRRHLRRVHQRRNVIRKKSCGFHLERFRWSR